MTLILIKIIIILICILIDTAFIIGCFEVNGLLGIVCAIVLIPLNIIFYGALIMKFIHG